MSKIFDNNRKFESLWQQRRSPAAIAEEMKKLLREAEAKFHDTCVRYLENSNKYSQYQAGTEELKSIIKFEDVLESELEQAKKELLFAKSNFELQHSLELKAHQEAIASSMNFSEMVQNLDACRDFISDFTESAQIDDYTAMPIYQIILEKIQEHIHDLITKIFYEANQEIGLATTVFQVIDIIEKKQAQLTDIFQMVAVIQEENHQSSNFSFHKNSYQQASEKIDQIAKDAIEKNKAMQQQISQLKKEDVINVSYPEAPIPEEKLPQKQQSLEVIDQLITGLERSNNIDRCIQITLNAMSRTVKIDDYEDDPQMIDQESHHTVDLIKLKFDQKIYGLINQKIQEFKEERLMYHQFHSLFSSSKKLKEEIKHIILKAKSSMASNHPEYLNGLLNKNMIEIDALTKEKSQSLIKKIIDGFQKEIESLKHQSDQSDSAVIIQKIAILFEKAEKKMRDLGFHPEKDSEQQGMYAAAIDQLNQIKSEFVKKEMDSHHKPKNIIMDYITKHPKIATVLLGVSSLFALKFILPAAVVVAIAKIGMTGVHALINHAAQARLLAVSGTSVALAGSAYTLFRHKIRVPSQTKVKNHILELTINALTDTLNLCEQRIQKHNDEDNRSFFTRMFAADTPDAAQAADLKRELALFRSLTSRSDNTVIVIENVIRLIKDHGAEGQMGAQLATALKRDFELQPLTNQQLIDQLNGMKSHPESAHLISTQSV